MTHAAPRIWPTTPLQQGLVALAELDRPDGETAGTAVESAQYLGQSVIRMRGPVDLDVLRAAIGAVLTEQPHLHAGLLMSHDVAPVQFIDTAVPPVIQVHPGGDGGPADVPQVLSWQRTLTWQLDRPPLLRWDVVVTDAEAVALVIAAHHAVLDGWSMPLLTAQIARHYALLVGAATDVPATRGTYGDHLTWLAEQDAEAAHRFWSAHLGDLNQTTPAWLGVAGRTRHPASITVELPTLDPSRLTERGLTPAAVARTCWGLSLDAVAGAIATPYAVAVSTRAAAVRDADDLIGLTTDAVLVAERPDPRTDVLTEAVRAQRRWVQTLPHQHVGLRGIHTALRAPERASSLFAVETSPEATTFEAGAVTFELAQVQDDTHYPLAATVHLSGSTGPTSWRLELTYDTNRAGAATAHAHADAFIAFVQAATVGTPIGGVDVLGREQRQLLERAQTRPAGPEPADDTTPPLLPTVFRDTCSRFAQRVALVEAAPNGESSRWTFAQLASEVTALRDELTTLLPADSAATPVVAIAQPRSARTVIALLAVLDAGATTLVLDPELPGPRREQILTEVDAALTLTGDAVQVRHDRPRGTHARPPHAADLAAVVLTSGSSGTPKPVAVPHRALAHLLADHVRDLHPCAESDPRHVAHTAAFHFDAHWDALLAMFLGHTVHVLTPDLYLDPYALADYTADERIDYLDLTPTVWSALLAADAFTRLPRVCVLGGEALPADLWSQLRARTAGSESTALNLYGPTEATVDAAWACVSDHPTPVVGRPAGRTGALVLDDLLRRVPPGTPGELYLTGPQLAHGYLARPGLSAERFVANPYPRRLTDGRIRPGDERMYRTGDVAQWSEDGLIVLGGRTDAQLSLAGRRVEPGEIEAVLCADDRVREAVVLARDSASGRGRLVGYVVPHHDAAAPSPRLVHDLLDAARDTLPAALVPADLVVLPAWPLNANGKLDRAALPEPARHPHDGAPTAAAAAAHSGASADVQACLAHVLGVAPEQVRADADFFALGGDSITAIQVCARLRGSGWAVQPGQVLTARTVSTIAALARPVEVAVNPSDSDTATAVTAGAHREGTELHDPFDLLTQPRRDDLRAHLAHVAPQARPEQVLPLSPTQLGIYIDAHRWQPDPYRTTITLRVDSHADGADIDRAVAAWFTRHPSLRVAVWQGDLAEPVAVVLRDIVVPRRHLEAPDLGEEGISELLDRVRREEQDRDLSFDAARLAGYTWIRTSPRTSYLVVSMHHLLADGWSTPVLADELQQALTDAGRGHRDTDTVFADYLHWWRSCDHAAVEDLWRHEFADAATPTLLGTVSAQACSGRRLVTAVDLGTDESEALRATGRRDGVTLAAACQAAWAVVLADLTGHTDVTYLLASSGRPDHLRGIESAVGMFVTTRPVRVRAETPLPQLAHDVTAAVARTETAAHLGLGRITQLVGTVADTLVVVENYPRRQTQAGAADGVDASRAPRVTPIQGTDSTTFPVTATVMLGDRPRLEVEIDPARCDLDPDLLAQSWRATLGRFWGEACAVATPTRTPVRDRRDEADTRPDSAVPESALAAQTDLSAEPDGSDEQTVRQVMASVLDLPSITARTSFFEAGGDSILAVRLVGALRRHGLRVAITDVFTAGNARALAARAVTETHEVTGGTDLGRVHLTPALCWYRDIVRRGGSGRGFQQLRTVRFAADTPITAVGAAAQRLLDRHDALRLRVDLDVAQIVAAPPVRLAVVAAETLPAQLRRLADEIDPGAGDLVRFAVVPGPAAVDVIMLAHHIAVDAVSWGILTDELVTLVAGGHLPPAPSFAGWTRIQARETVLRQAALAAPTWLRTLQPAPAIATATRDSDLGLVGDAHEIDVRLDAATTAALLTVARHGKGMETVMMAALTAARTDDLVVEIEGHGRPSEVDPTDPRAQTPDAGAVGWFTATWPLRLPGLGEAHRHRAGDTERDAGQVLSAHLARTGQAIAGARASGPDYGLVRHLHPQLGEVLAAAERRCPPQVLLNYLGTMHIDGDTDPGAMENDLGLHAGLPVSHPIEINAHLEPARPGTDQDAPVLVARWQVAAPLAAHAATLAQEWTQALRALADLEPTPQPAPIHDAVGLSPHQVQAVHEKTAGQADAIVQAVWPPTPVQRGMIFHGALAAQGEAGAAQDPYTSVSEVGLVGAVRPALLHRACQDVLARHPQLRLRVRWITDDESAEPVAMHTSSSTDQVSGREGGVAHRTRPVLVTVASTDVSWRLLDIGVDPDTPDPESAVTAIREQERRHRYDLETDPLLRVTLIRTGVQTYRLILGNHHLLLDGWSMPLLLDAVLERYADLLGGDQSDVAMAADPVGLAHTPYARHVTRASAALHEGAQAALERRVATLSGSDAGPVTRAEPGDPLDQGAIVERHERIASAAQRHGTTQAAIVATAWGAALAAVSGSNDALFGTVVSGRDPQEDTDLLGMFTDTVPVLAHFGTGAAIADVVGDLAGQIAAAMAEPALGLARLASALGRAHLFDALLVVENYPGGDLSTRAGAAGLEVVHLDGDDATHYPLSLTVETATHGSELRLEHDRSAVPHGVAESLLRAVRHVLDRLVEADPAAPADTLTRAAATLTEKLPVTSSDHAGSGAFPADAPSQALHSVLAIFTELFADAAGSVHADANFFALGGDSILAMSLVTACRERGLQIRAADVFGAPTPRELATRAVPSARPERRHPTPNLAGTEPDSSPKPLIDLDGRGAAALDDLLRSL